MNRTAKENIILVTGATGAQGGTVAAALLKSGNTVRIFVRPASVHSPVARQLEAAGAQLVLADMDNPASITAAMEGVYGLYSVAGMDDGTDSERRHTTTLVNAAIASNVQHIVHSSVNRTGSHATFPHEDKWNKKYWLDKQYGEELVRNAGFRHWTLLRPVFFMDNFIPPKVNFMFPRIADGEIVVAFKPSSKLQLVAVEDIGAFATAAFNDPAPFDRQAIDLAGDELTIQNILALIGKAAGRPIKAIYTSEEELVKKGTPADFANFQEWINDVGYNVDLEKLKGYGLPITSFERWLVKNLV